MKYKLNLFLLFTDLPGFTRSVYERDHALITPESHVVSPLPEWYCSFSFLWISIYFKEIRCYSHSNLCMTGQIHWGHILLRQLWVPTLWCTSQRCKVFSSQLFHVSFCYWSLTIFYFLPRMFNVLFVFFFFGLKQAKILARLLFS
jgi:hypothetical protein